MASASGIHFTKTLWGTVSWGRRQRTWKENDNYEKRSPADFRLCREAQKTLCREIEERDLAAWILRATTKTRAAGGQGHRGFCDHNRDSNVPQAIHLVGD